eukprot:CAMPEP_0179015068 /NCGR_PEP_ID=MMETSP0796-20121207/2595_1 /TAXON_ID=73915 /ORGANISM="Pyrodinium bahamense, Strain pbaha01" /LENGTH=141 /DNA_ID=CAMNT_0020710679 /DNA_START=482 /DNA_END=908 /DNA_ORIENTATION=+
MHASSAWNWGFGMRRGLQVGPLSMPSTGAEGGTAPCFVTAFFVSLVPSSLFDKHTDVILRVRLVGWAVRLLPPQALYCIHRIHCANEAKGLVHHNQRLAVGGFSSVTLADGAAPLHSATRNGLTTATDSVAEASGNTRMSP